MSNPEQITVRAARPGCAFRQRVVGEREADRLRAELRGTGLGRSLVEFAEARSRELGCDELWLMVNRHNRASIAFYERVGFRKTGEMQTGIGAGFVLDDWRMAKPVRRLPAT